MIYNGLPICKEGQYCDIEYAKPCSHSKHHHCEGLSLLNSCGACNQILYKHIPAFIDNALVHYCDLGESTPKQLFRPAERKSEHKPSSLPLTVITSLYGNGYYVGYECPVHGQCGVVSELYETQADAEQDLISRGN